MNADPVKFILAKRQNFDTAAAVAAAWPEVRQKVVHGFLDRLDGRLKRHLKGWQSMREQDFYEDWWASYDIWNPEWNHRYGIGLMWADHGRAISFGVYYNTDFRKRPKQDQILQEVVKLHPSAKSDQWWEARVRYRNPSDWTTPEVLWQMHNEEKFLHAVADNLISVANISIPTINKLVRKQ